MKVELTTSVRQRETTCHENRHKPWIIFHISSSSSNTCFLMRSVLTAVHLRYICSLHHHIPLPTHPLTNSHLYLITSCCQLIFKPKLSSYFRLVSENISLCDTPGFFKSSLITVIIHLWLADLQQVLWLNSLRSAGHSVDSLSAFSSYFFFSLSFPRD